MEFRRNRGLGSVVGLSLALSMALGTGGCRGGEVADGMGAEDQDSKAEKAPGAKDKKKKGSSKSKGDGKDKSKDDEDAHDPGDPGDPGEMDPESSDGGPKFDIVIPDGDEDGPKPDKELGCDIDFLFVVDNSGSMRDEQQNLASSVPGFIKTITEKIEKLEEYHIGVVSTDESIFNAPAACATMGGLINKTFPPMGGSIQKCGPYANGKHFMTRKDELEESFGCAASIGVVGSGNERPMDAMFAALGPDLSAAGACNEDFFRKDSILVVVIITDEEDDPETNAQGEVQGSKGDPKEWYKKLLALKDNRPEYLVVLSLIGIPKPNECEKTHETGKTPGLAFVGAEIAPRLKEFTELFGDRGFVGDVCAKSYEGFFSKAVGVLELACTELPG